MNIILVGNYKGIPRNHNLGRLTLFLAVGLSVIGLLAGAVGYAGYLLGSAQQIQIVHAAPPTDEIAKLDRMMEQLARQLTAEIQRG